MFRPSKAIVHFIAEGSCAVSELKHFSTTVVWECSPIPIFLPKDEAIEQSLEAHRPFLCALAIGRESTVKVFEDHQRGGILGSFFKQTENFSAFLLFCAQRSISRGV
jgi:hypothetical protein